MLTLTRVSNTATEIEIDDRNSIGVAYAIGGVVSFACLSSHKLGWVWLDTRLLDVVNADWVCSS